MELKTFEHLYRKMFLQTNGFMLNWPIGQHVNVGDFFILKPNKLSVVGHIPVDILNAEKSYDEEPLEVFVPAAVPDKKSSKNTGTFPTNAWTWRMMEGCASDYVSNKMLTPHKSKLQPPDVNQYITYFENESNFFFSAKEASIKKVLDFHKLHKRIIRILATQFFNYSEVYFITEVAILPNFSMGISKRADAKLIMSLDNFHNGDIMDVTSSEIPLGIEKTEGLSHLKIREKGGPIAFRALKMSLSLKAKDEIMKKLEDTENKELEKYIAEIIEQNLHNLVPSIEINPSNAGEFFEWRPMGLEDVEVFLGVK